MHRGVAAVWLEPSAQSQAEVQPPAPNMDAADSHQEDVGGEADDEADGQNLLTATPYDGFAKAVAKAVASHTPQHEPPRARAPEQCVVLPGTVVTWFIRRMRAGRLPGRRLVAADLAEARVPLVTGGYKNMWHFLADDLSAVEAAEERR